jgi:CheY-like chemotaxis protein
MNHLYLIAEDEKDTQTLVEHAFKMAGFDFPIQFVSDGQEALDYLRGVGNFGDRAIYPFPALLLLDFDMPKLDGLDVLKEVRADPKLRKFVVVMFSSSVDEKQIEKAFELGVNSFVEKPTEFNELVQSIICINQYWFGCNHFPHSSHGIVRPQKRHRPGIGRERPINAKIG